MENCIVALITKGNVILFNEHIDVIAVDDCVFRVRLVAFAWTMTRHDIVERFAIALACYIRVWGGEGFSEAKRFEIYGRSKT